MKKTIGGPKRFRPKTREELENELGLTEKRLRLAMLKIKKLADTPRRYYEKESPRYNEPVQPPMEGNNSSERGIGVHFVSFL